MEENKGIQKRIRIHDNNNWKFIEELMLSSEYSKNFNAVINDALKIGLPLLYERTFNLTDYLKSQRKIANYENGYELRDLNNSVDELAVQVGIIKYLVTNLYNIELEKLEGTLSVEQIEGGFLSSLPENLQEIEDSMLAANKRREKKNE